jgi:hypothetical protein
MANMEKIPTIEKTTLKHGNIKRIRRTPDEILIVISGKLEKLKCAGRVQQAELAPARLACKLSAKAVPNGVKTL